MRPDLTINIKIEDFKNHYCLKGELEDFCKKHGINSYGPKIELAERIEVFLSTGKIKEPKKETKKKRNIEQTNLSLDTIITEDHRCSQNVRAFFKTVIPKFHFSTYIQNYFKENVGKTYKDALDAWNEEELRKKDPAYVKKIGPQFEYNQFIHEFFKDPKNKGKVRNDAIKE